ncbi:phage protein [Entomomonas asaccharolytica]|uniref:Uncharacterized protein n=1 Tax=Entomomonas asaccharolytica TaxID=2785331 RepID=A0A974NI73_9GAMM|nr:hypothetical protein [Entomomonas asaccharolytica]QQP86949.1 hypothetical protein JHT90_06805 [Entomomonas asaccharolytica]
MRQFNRQYRLEIGNLLEGIAIDKLRVSFDIEKSLNPTPNPANIKIWNLSRSNMNKILAKEYTNVRLFVGYGELRAIFSGNIIKSKVVRDDLDFIVEIEVGDGDEDLQNASISETLAEGSDDYEAIDRALLTMPLTQKGIIYLPKNKKKPREKTLCGNSKDIIDQVAKQNGCDWSIQDGLLHVIPSSHVLPSEAVYISQDTGMIGSPEDTGDGLEVKCLLNPALTCGGMIRLKSILSFFNGDYKITNLKISGDALGGDWTCTITTAKGEYKKVTIEEKEQQQRGETDEQL